MQKAFSFPEPPEADEGAVAESLTLVINEESFELMSDLGGQELLTLVARAYTGASGTHALISRAIKDDDWERWIKTVRYVKLRDFSTIGGAIVDLYANFPTTAEAGS